MNKNSRLIGLAAFLVALAACARVAAVDSTATCTPAPTPDVARIAREYPKVDGSTSTQPLHTVVACQLFGVKCAWREWITGERRMVPVTDPSKVEQARAVLKATEHTGKVVDWGSLGGRGAIKAYQRDRNSGSQELMEALVMKGAPMIQAPDMLIETMIGAVNAIGREPAGIGYSVYYYATVMLRDWLLTAEGQAAVAQSGYVPLSPL